MKIILETTFKKGSKAADILSVAIDSDDIVKLANSKGFIAANIAIDKFVEKYTNDIKAKLANVLKS